MARPLPDPPDDGAGTVDPRFAEHPARITYCAWVCTLRNELSALSDALVLSSVPREEAAAIAFDLGQLEEAVREARAAFVDSHGSLRWR